MEGGLRQRRSDVAVGRSLGERRRERLREARLYLVVEARPPGRPAESLLRAALAGGVDMVQLRDKEADDEEILRAAHEFRRVCAEQGALLWLNDRPDLAVEAGADGVHVGQGDAPVEEVRERVGEDLLIGLSTHSPAQFDAAVRSDADELSVGPVVATPTKPGRAAAGLEYVRYAAATRTSKPWFAIGGIDLDSVEAVVDAGARCVAVVRAIRDSADPRRAAGALRAVLDRGPSGPAQ